MKKKWLWDIECSVHGIVKRGKRHSASLTCHKDGKMRWVKRGSRAWKLAVKKNGIHKEEEWKVR